MKNIILLIVSLMIYLGCNGETPYTGGGGKGVAFSIEPSSLYKSKNEEILFLSGTYNYNVDKTNKSFIPRNNITYNEINNFEDRYIYYGSIDSKYTNKIRDFLNKSLLTSKCKNDRYKRSETPLFYSLFTKSFKPVKDNFATECSFLLLSANQQNIIIENKKKVIIDSEDFDYSCFKLDAINIGGKSMFPVYTFDKKNTTNICKSLQGRNYIAYWDDLNNGMVLEEINDFLKHYTKLDLNKLLKLGVNKSTLIDKDGIHTIELKDKQVVYNYLNFDTNNTVIIKEKLEKFYEYK